MPNDISVSSLVRKIKQSIGNKVSSITSIKVKAPTNLQRSYFSWHALLAGPRQVHRILKPASAWSGSEIGLMPLALGTPRVRGEYENQPFDAKDSGE
jgi:hypothetical protein